MLNFIINIEFNEKTQLVIKSTVVCILFVCFSVGEFNFIFHHKVSASNLLANVPILSGNVCGVWIGVGDDDAGVLNNGTVTIFSRKPSNCFRDNALCSVSNGRIGGTPPNPSKTRRLNESERENG